MYWRGGGIGLLDRFTLPLQFRHFSLHLRHLFLTHAGQLQRLLAFHKHAVHKQFGRRRYQHGVSIGSCHRVR